MTPRCSRRPGGKVPGAAVAWAVQACTSQIEVVNPTPVILKYHYSECHSTYSVRLKLASWWGSKLLSAGWVEAARSGGSRV